MEGKENYVLRNRKDIRSRFRLKRPELRVFGRNKLLEKQLADEALPRRRPGRQMPVMRKMLRAVRAKDVFLLSQVVMVKRRKEHHRQDNRQQPGGKYASFQGHNACKGTKKKN